MNLKTLKGQVELILASDEASRNSDITLTIGVWKRFYPEKVRLMDGGVVEYVALQDLFDLPHESEIGRVRRVFQNDLYQYVPTDEAVAKARRINEEKWREALGYAPRPVHHL